MYVFMGNLHCSSKKLKCHISFMTYDLKFTPLGTHRPMMAANEGITEAIASFCRGDSDTVFLDLSYNLRSNIIPANFF